MNKKSVLNSQTLKNDISAKQSVLSSGKKQGADL